MSESSESEFSVSGYSALEYSAVCPNPMFQSLQSNVSESSVEKLISNFVK